MIGKYNCSNKFILMVTDNSTVVVCALCNSYLDIWQHFGFVFVHERNMFSATRARRDKLQIWLSVSLDMWKCFFFFTELSE